MKHAREELIKTQRAWITHMYTPPVQSHITIISYTVEYTNEHIHTHQGNKLNVRMYADDSI